MPDDRAGAAGAELGVLVTGGRAGGRDEDGLDVGALGAGLRPGVLGRAEAPPPLATARAAAASAGLEAPRIGAGVLFAGAGVATVGPEDDGTGRTLLDWGRELLEDGVVAGRLLLPDPADSDEEAGVDEDDGVGRPLDEPEEEEGVAPIAGRAGATAGRAEAAGRAADGVAAGGVLVTDGMEAVAVDASERPVAGRTRVVSSVLESFVEADVTCGDASVLIGTVPPPGFCRDVLSDRWLLSELTSSPPCSSSRRGTAV